jgi:MIP family channel proteins
LRAGPPASAVLAEAIGTFALVFIGCGAIAVGTLGPGAVAAAFGLVVMTMVYALGRISGAHINPAVTVALASDRRFPWPRVIPYWLAQVGGAIAAAALLQVTLGEGLAAAVTRPSTTELQALVFEVALTFFLGLVIAAVSDVGRAGRAISGVAIGGAVATGSRTGGPVRGASMNPARSLGPATVSGDLTALWIYHVGPSIGALDAIVAYRFLRRDQGPA